MPYQGSFRYSGKNEVILSLREAAKKSQKGKRDKTKCLCSSTCKIGRCSCRCAGLSCSSHCHPKNFSCLNKEVEDNSMLKSQQQLKRKRIPQKTSEPKPKCQKRNVDAIKNGEWLGDQEIECANLLLRKQFPEIHGFHSPLLGQNFSFPVLKAFFIQILNAGNHWVAVAGSSPSLVHVYDSVYDYTFESTKMQVASIMKSNESMITFKIHNTQFQKGSSDCGLFLIAYATDLAYGNDPASYRYDQTKLRSHFLECLRERISYTFSKTDGNSWKSKVRGNFNLLFMPLS